MHNRNNEVSNKLRKARSEFPQAIPKVSNSLGAARGKTAPKMLLQKLAVVKAEAE